jgi:hypothetical protein
MARQVARREPAAATGGGSTGAESAEATYQDRVFVITPRPPVTLVSGAVALDVSSIDDIRTGASVADADEVMAVVTAEVNAVREERYRERHSA